MTNRVRKWEELSREIILFRTALIFLTILYETPIYSQNWRKCGDV
jgi:hypothetical protein